MGFLNVLLESCSDSSCAQLVCVWCWETDEVGRKRRRKKEEEEE